MASTQLLIALTLGLSVGWQPPQPAQSVPDCHRREPGIIAERERAAAQWPSVVLRQIELAICYDKAWRFQDVEPAIQKARAVLDAEIASAPPAQPPAVPVVVPKRIKDAQADYPTDALVAGITGSVIVELSIDTKGNVRDARVVQSVRELDDAAVKAARKWKYEPTVIEGKPVEVRSYASIRFGQTAEPIPADWLAMAAFYYERGFLALAQGALDQAVTKAREDKARFGDYVPVMGGGAAGGVTPPRKIKNVVPKYPSGALSSRTQGTVIIEALIDRNGNVGRARVLSKPSVLDAASLQAVLQWQFEPATRGGQPVPTVFTGTVSFNIGPSR